MLYLNGRLLLRLYLMTQEIELGDFKYSINIEGKTASVLEGKPYQKE